MKKSVTNITKNQEATAVDMSLANISVEQLRRKPCIILTGEARLPLVEAINQDKGEKKYREIHA